MEKVSYYKGAITGGSYGDFLSTESRNCPGPNCSGEFANIYFTLPDADALTGSTVYLSLTVARTEVFPGYVDIGAIGNTSGALIYPVEPPLSTFLSGVSPITTWSGSLVGGTHLLFDVTAAVNSAALGTGVAGFILNNQQSDGTFFAAIGRNYLSGYPDCSVSPDPECVYFATSLYEYPILIVTSDGVTTPFDQLATRPIVNDPTGYPTWPWPPVPPGLPDPPATGIPEPMTLALFGAGLIGAIQVKRRARKVTSPR
jgi:hypothetical protein